MKKYIPFILTGLISFILAISVSLFFSQPQILIQPARSKPVFTNYSPFDYTSGGGSAAAPDMVKASNGAKKAVVYIESRETTGGYFTRRNYGGSTGSGVIISPDGYIATNHHVVERGNQIMVLLDDGREFEARLIGSDPSTDLALLKIDSKALPYLVFGNSDSLQVGEWVLAIGNPFRLYSTVTAGIVSAKARNINILDEGGIENFIQTDAAVNPGNSGGALVNTQGQLMGINTAIMTFSGQYEGFSFAVPSNLARKVFEDIRQYGSPKRGWLGVVIHPVDNQAADAAGLKEIMGIVLDQVYDGSAAARAGLKAGDIILSIDGQKVTSSPDFIGKIGQYHPGDVLTLTYVRDHKTKEVQVKLSDSRNGSKTDITSAQSPEKILENIGLTVRDFNTLEKLKLPKEGVLVTNISKDSQIERVNMEENFIITRLNGVPVKNVAGLKRELQQAGTSLYLQGYYEKFPGDFAYTLAIN